MGSWRTGSRRAGAQIVTRDKPALVFSHGQESGPWGRKIRAMADIGRHAGLPVESIDYQGIADPLLRVEKLLDYARDLITSRRCWWAAVWAVSSRWLRLPGSRCAVCSCWRRRCICRATKSICLSRLPTVLPPSCTAGGMRWCRAPAASAGQKKPSARLLLVDGEHRLTSQLDFIERQLSALIDELLAG